MVKWKNRRIGDVINFNPIEKLEKNTIAKKIPMAYLSEFVKSISGFQYSEYKAGPKFRNGDTLLAKITPCLENGKTAQVDILEEDEVAFGSSEFIVLRETDETTNNFIYYLAISPAFRKRAISCMEGTSGRKRVNESALKNQILPIPDKIYQSRVSVFLSNLDSKISLNNRINQKLEAMAKLIYDYWFVQFDFPTSDEYAVSVGKPELEGKPYKSSGGKMVYNKELKREIPEGWEVKELKEFANTGSGGTPLKSKSEYYQNGDIPWINSGEVNQPFIVSTENFISKSGMDNSSAKIFKKGSILMAMYGATAGKVSQIDFDATTNQAICAIWPQNVIYTDLIRFGLSRLYEYLVNLSSGSARDNLSQDKIKHLKFLIPNEQLLALFHSTVDPMMTKIKMNYHENKKLSDLRDWLLPMLMNGQVTIKEAEGYLQDGEVSMAAEERGEYG